MAQISKKLKYNEPAPKNIKNAGVVRVQNYNDTVEDITALYTAINNIPMGLVGTNYIVVIADGTPAENGTALFSAYTAAQSFGPSANNRYTIVAAPGYYGISQPLVMDTPFIDLVSLTGNQDVILERIDSADPFTFNGSYWVTSYGEVIKITADNIKLVGITGVEKSSPNFNNYFGTYTTYRQPIRVINNLPNLYIENCNGGDFGFGSDENSFNPLTEPVTVSGTFVNCTAGVQSFGSYGNATGTFINCTAYRTQSFAFRSNATGYFENCKALENNSFGYGFSNAISGTMVSCTAKANSFGFSTLINGKLKDCTGGGSSFGTFGGTITGKLYYCELTQGNFPSVSPGGIILYCIDASGPNNQGFVVQNKI